MMLISLFQLLSLRELLLEDYESIDLNLFLDSP